MKALRVVVLSLFATLLLSPQPGVAEEALAPASRITPLQAPGEAPFLDSGDCQTAGTVPSFLEVEAATPRANFCTKEVCSVNRQDCRTGCLPCGFVFQCNFPGCYSCQCVC